MKFTIEKAKLRNIISVTNKIAKFNKFEVIYLCHDDELEWISVVGGSNKGIIVSTILGEYKSEYKETMEIYPIKGTMFNTIINNAPDGDLTISIMDNGKKIKISIDEYHSTIRIDDNMNTSLVKQGLELIKKIEISDDIHDDQQVEFTIDKDNITEMCATAQINFGKESNKNALLSMVFNDNNLSIINKTPNYIVKNNITISNNKSQETALNIQMSTVKNYFNSLRALDESFSVLIEGKYEYIETESKEFQCVTARPMKVPLPSIAILKAFKTLSHKLISIDVDKKAFIGLLQNANSMSINSSAIISLSGSITQLESTLNLNHSTAIGKVENKVPIVAHVFDNKAIDITNRLDNTTFVLNGLNAPRLKDSIAYLNKLDDKEETDDLYGTIKLDILIGFKMQENGNPINFIQLGFDSTNILYSTNLEVNRFVEKDSEAINMPEIKYFNDILKNKGE